MIRIKQKLARGELVRIFGATQLLSTKLVEIVGDHGHYDGLWLDAEHGGLTQRDIELATLAAKASGLEAFVRLPATDYATIMRPLEAGAGGVMVSMIHSAEEAEQAVRWAKFYPRGTRGINNGNRDGRFGRLPIADYVVQANAQTFVGLQIETQGALEQIEAIVQVPDVDLIFVGPADLSQMLGVPGQVLHPDCLAAVDRIATVCARFGKPWGVVPIGTDHGRVMLEKGCRMFVCGFDIHAMHAGLDALKERHSYLDSGA